MNAFSFQGIFIAAMQKPLLSNNIPKMIQNIILVGRLMRFLGL